MHPHLRVTLLAALATTPVTAHSQSNIPSGDLRTILAQDAAREPQILQQIRAGSPNLGTLYGEGLHFAALQQLSGQPAAAVATVRSLDTALEETNAHTPGEMAQVDTARRQYALLGQPLPTIPCVVSLFAPHETPRINTDYGSATLLFLFPPGCASCIHMAQNFMATLYRLSGRNVHIYGLLAQDPPPVPAPGAPPIPPNPNPTPAEQLHHTPTLIVPPSTLQQFAATDFPLLIAVDPQGIIRYLQPVPATALDPGALADQVAAQIARQWPRP